MINFKNIFNDIIKKEFDFKAYDKKDYENILDTIKFIFKRQNNKDKKIMKFMKFKISE